MWSIGQHTNPETGAVAWQVRLADDPTTIIAAACPDRAAAMVVVAEQLAGALVAAAPDAPVGPRFLATFEEGQESRDGSYYRRVIDAGATQFDRAMPIPLMATDETTWAHEGAVLVGAITSGARAGATTVNLEGRFDTSPRALEFARQVDDGMLTRHSPDLIGPVDDEFECTEYDEEWGWCEEGILHFVQATLGGTTIVPFPALDDAMITLPDGLEVTPANELAASAEPVVTTSTGWTPAPAAVVAAADVARPAAPFAASWFEDPALEAPTPLTVTAEGRVFGHVAAWGTCHIGHPGTCVTPPHSATSYAYAHTRPAVDLDNGTALRVGSITIGTGHAPLSGVDADRAAGHYDDTGFSAALVRYGEDEHGIWCAGVVNPGATDEQVWALQIAAPSGDWRRIDGNLELVATLGVNVPGFPIPDTLAASAAGECTALVAAGVRGMARLGERRPVPDAPSPEMAALVQLRDVLARLESRVGAIESNTELLAPAMVEALAGRIDRTPLSGMKTKPVVRRDVALGRTPVLPR